MDEFQIDRATPDDAERLAEVYHSAYARNRELGFPASAETVAASEVVDWIRDRRVYVARVDGEVVGGLRAEESDPDRVKLSRFGVHEDWKGQGVGSGLLDHAEGVAREAGYERVWLTTPGEHPFLPDLYRSRGYEKTGDYPLARRDYDEIVMEKRL